MTLQIKIINYAGLSLKGSGYCEKKKSIKFGLGLLDHGHLFFEMLL
jgi:hypothetical protein